MKKMLVTVEMIDGTVYEDVRILLADQMKHADVARRHHWGPVDDDQIRTMAFWAYAALVRLGHYDKDKGFDEFVSEVAQIDAQNGDEVNPTR